MASCRGLQEHRSPSGLVSVHPIWALHPASRASSRLPFNFRDLPSSESHSLNPSPPPAPSFHETSPQGETEIIGNAHGLMYVTAGPGCPLSYSHQGQDKEMLEDNGDVAQLLTCLHGCTAPMPIALQEMGMAAQSCNPRIWEMNAGGSGVQGPPQLVS